MFSLVRRVSPKHARVARVLLASALPLALAGCAESLPAPRPPTAETRAAEKAGKTIYFGTVTPLGSEPAPPTFVYERRVAHADAGLLSTHLTRDPSGRIVLAESAASSADYVLQRYDLRQDQLGRTGSVEIANGMITFRLREGEGRAERTAIEPLREPVVVGPTLVGHIVRHLAELSAGASLTVRLALLDRLETIPFRLERGRVHERLGAGGGGRTQIVMRPTSFLIGLAVDPITFTFETASGKLVLLEGRVPPKVARGGKLAPLDARVDYQHVADAYE